MANLKNSLRKFGSWLLFYEGYPILARPDATLSQVELISARKLRWYSPFAVIFALVLVTIHFRNCFRAMPTRFIVTLEGDKPHKEKAWADLAAKVKKHNLKFEKVKQ